MPRSSSPDAPAPTAREKAAALRREQAARERRRTLLLWVGAAVVVVLVAGAVTFAVIRDRANRPSLADVKTYTETAQQHTTSPVTYPQTPPVGGAHNPVWLNCGVYTSPVPNENAVHSMEHGAVWVTYSPDLSAADVATLKAALPDTYTILSPYDGLPAPVVASAWGVQLYLTGADDPRLPLFVSTYRQGPQTPEPGAACTGGTDGTTTGAATGP